MSPITVFFMILVVAVMWVFKFRPLVKQLQSRWRERQLESPDRPADPGALDRLAKFPAGKVFIARPVDQRLKHMVSSVIVGLGLWLFAWLQYDLGLWQSLGVGAIGALLIVVFAMAAHRKLSRQAVRIDVHRAEVEFRNFKFVADLVGNRTPASQVIPFSDLLAARVITTHGTSILEVKTRRGKVLVPSALQPFNRLASLMHDAVEANRSSATFRDTYRLKPRTTTSLFEIGLIVVAIAIMFGYYYWHRRGY